MFTDVGFSLISGFTKKLCSPENPLPNITVKNLEMVHLSVIGTLLGVMVLGKRLNSREGAKLLNLPTQPIRGVHQTALLLNQLISSGLSLRS